jgi:hypothetical protein
LDVLVLAMNEKGKKLGAEMRIMEAQKDLEFVIFVENVARRLHFLSRMFAGYLRSG